MSASSTMTLTHAEDSKQQTTTFSDVPDEDTTCSLPSSPQSYAEGTLRRSSTIVSSEKDRSTEKNAPEETSWKMDAEACRRRLSHTSTITLTNVSNTGIKNSTLSILSTLSNMSIVTMFEHSSGTMNATGLRRSKSYSVVLYNWWCDPSSKFEPELKPFEPLLMFTTKTKF